MKNNRSGDQFIDIAAAIQSAEIGMSKLIPPKNSEISAFLSKSKPISALFVKRLDTPEQSYYLIPWKSSKGIGLIAQVNATSGVFLGVAEYRKPIAFPFISADRALSIANQIVSGEPIGSPVLVWKPCRESTNPQRPFYQIAYKNKNIYVDMDGNVLSNLSPLGRGG